MYLLSWRQDMASNVSYDMMNVSGADLLLTFTCALK